MANSMRRALAPALGLAAFGAVMAAGGVFLSSSETLMRVSFAAALSPKDAPAASKVAAAASLSGSEDFWLTALRNDGGAPVSKAVSIGDKIAMSLDGKDRKLEVVAVNEFTPTKTEIDTRSSGVRLVLVTALDSADANKRPIRFVMELEAAPAQIAAPRPAHTL